MLMLFYATLPWLEPGRISDEYARVVASPTFKHYTSLLSFDALLNGRIDIFWDVLKHRMMPILTLSYISWATFLRVTRGSMLETLRTEYVTTARAKGLPERDVINKHAKPNAMMPVVTLAGFQIIGLGRCGDHRNGVQLSRDRIGRGPRCCQPGRGNHIGVCALQRVHPDCCEPGGGYPVRLR